MNRLRLISFFVLSLALSSYGFAKDHDGKRHDHDRDDVRHHDRDRDGDHDRDDHRVLRHRDHDRDDRRIIHVHHSSTPPGAEHGKKVGWGNCNMPPGQAKKAGCHSTVRHHHHHTIVVHHDRDRDRDRRRHVVSSHVATPGTNTGVRPVGNANGPAQGSAQRDPMRPVRVNEVKQ